MKTRMTFRLPDSLAKELRRLPNQTQFVEQALKEALGMECPACSGTGRIPAGRPAVTNFREHRLPRLGRNQALQLRALMQLAGQLAADEVSISQKEGRFEVTLRRHGSSVMQSLLPLQNEPAMLEVSE